jgi:M3 family oligoendopeptidase
MTERIDLLQFYSRPNFEQLRTQEEQLAKEATSATSEEAFLGVVSRWNKLRSTLRTQESIAYVRYRQDTQDPANKKEVDFLDEARPIVSELGFRFAKTLLDSPYLAAVEKKFGKQLVDLKKCEAVTFAPAIKNMLSEEAKLSTQYTELLSKQEIEFRGETYNLMGIMKFFADADRNTRYESQKAREAFLLKYVEELDSLYDHLTRVRDQMGKALQNENYIPLGYALMSRTAYGPKEVSVFREEIRREIVPLVGKMLPAQAKRLGIDKILFHDEGVLDLQGNPAPQGGVEFCIDAAQKMYRALGSEFGEFFDLMAQKGLLDLDTRPGKAPGGFCTIFDDLELPFVFANFNGSEGDVRVLTHECGHAFQVYQSRKQPCTEYKFPTSEACEVHSMSMEFLTYPYMPLFFGEAEAKRFYRVHIENNLQFLPYSAAVDHFQHEVYQTPSLTPKERRSLWREMEKMYLPFRDYAGLYPHLETGAIWQRQGHIYSSPFYYIDYALALTCALQFWKKAEENRENALKDYLKICSPGGSIPFPEMVKLGNLRSPFEPGCLRDIAQHAQRVNG